MLLRNEFVQSALLAGPYDEGMSRTLVIGALLTACSTTPQAKGPEMSNREIVRKLYEDCVNTGNVALLPTLIANDYVGPNGDRGPAGYEQIVTGLRAGFPDIHFTLDEVLTDGDKVVVRWTWRGTHTGNFRGFPPSRKAITTTGIVIYQLRDEKIVHSWLESDRLGVLQQIGVVDPNLGKPPPRPTK
jgi:steroid delta-isomerase-like uncharacterized protein